jgi:ABC-2 type transport system ATP-binding protein
VEAAFREPVDPREFEGIEGVREARAAGRRLHLVVAGEIDGVVKALAAHPVLSLSTPEPDLEEIFLGLYRGEGSEPTGDPGDDRAP